MRNLYEEKIKQQQDEITALRSNRVLFDEINRPKGAIPKTSLTTDKFRCSEQVSNFQDMSKTQGTRGDQIDPHMQTLQTLAKLLREMQLDTRQKHELLSQILDHNGNTRTNNTMPKIHEQPTQEPHILEPNTHELDIHQENVNTKPRDSYLRRLRLIPVFDGESYKALRNFLDIAHALNESWINNTEKNELIDTLNLQIRGEARDVVGDLYEITFEEMKDKMLKHFAYLVNKKVVTSQLENLRQNDKETMTEYLERARKLLKINAAHINFHQKSRSENMTEQLAEHSLEG